MSENFFMPLARGSKRIGITRRNSLTEGDAGPEVTVRLGLAGSRIGHVGEVIQWSDHPRAVPSGTGPMKAVRPTLRAENCPKLSRRLRHSSIKSLPGQSAQ